MEKNNNSLSVGAIWRVNREFWTKKLKKRLKKKRRSLKKTWLSDYLRLPIAEKNILYDAFSGLGVLDSPRAIFKELLARGDDFVHIWTVKNHKISEENLNEFRNLPNVIFVKRGSREYLKALSTAKYLVTNNTFPPYFGRRKGQIYLNTWHGIPLKAMGYERQGQRVDATKNVARNFLNATHIVGANDFTIRRLFKKAYMMEGIFRGKILGEPMPRTDLVQNTKHEYIEEKLARMGFSTDKKRIVYAPTWRGALYNQLQFDLEELKNFVRTLKEKIDTDRYQVYLRVHYFLYRAIKMDEELAELCIPFTVDTDELLSVTDVLISDYSSIFFDFLSTKRPILFYVPDLEDYAENRGLSIDPQDLPGPVAKDIDTVAHFISNLEEVGEQYTKKHQEMCTWCISREDGNVTKRVVDTVFYGAQSDWISCATEKKKLLFMADWTKNFAGQSQFTDFLNKIDYSKYDVTLLTGECRGQQKELLENINKNVRILVNTKAPAAPLRRRRKTRRRLKIGDISLGVACENYNMEHEWRKLTGNAEFDLCVQLQPTVSQFNWLLLGYVAKAQKKVFVYSHTFRPAVLNQERYRYHDVEAENLEDVWGLLDARA
ncbi:MAG: CDP-glycerol glycerophosphotransferase family protein [Oscillospiraceae bacterium]|nr:CDP-glycerol glycerophosphotransferase family protein [Oscillospiraceae bacterium]